jgi:hypothetical protein
MKKKNCLRLSGRVAGPLLSGGLAIESARTATQTIEGLRAHVDNDAPFVPVEESLVELGQSIAGDPE